MQPTDPSVITAIIIAVLVGTLIGTIATHIYYSPRLKRHQKETWAAARRFYLRTSSSSTDH
jgi:glycerol uptake facilitator-like aquaporin